MEGEFRELNVRLTFREAVQLFEHRSQFIRRSSDACLVRVNYSNKMAFANSYKQRFFFIVTDPQKPPWLFLIASILAACGTEFNSGARSALSARAAKPHRFSCSCKCKIFSKQSKMR